MVYWYAKHSAEGQVLNIDVAWWNDLEPKEENKLVIRSKLGWKKEGGGTLTVWGRRTEATTIVQGNEYYAFELVGMLIKSRWSVKDRWI